MQCTVECIVRVEHRHVMYRLLCAVCFKVRLANMHSHLKTQGEKSRLHGRFHTIFEVSKLEVAGVAVGHMLPATL